MATDASDLGLGAVLFQVVDGQQHIIECASRSLSVSEKNYSATKLELSGLLFALERFEYLILLRPFTVYTDHSALLSLFKAKFTYQVLTCEWYERVLRFIDTMSIVHCPGVQNVLPDLLSRSYKRPFVHMVNMANAVRLSDALLIKTVDDLQVRKELIVKAHGLGHFGAKAVHAQLVSEGHNWPGMIDDILIAIDMCEACMKFKVSRHGFHPLKSFDAMYPFEHVVIDLCGPFDITTAGSRMVLVVVDVATRMTFLRALEDKSAVSVARAMVVLMCQYGTFKVLSSDNGTEFVNSVLEEIAGQWKMEKRVTTPYHPQGNGIAENKVSALKKSLEKMAFDVHKLAEDRLEWDLLLPVVELALNVKVNDTTKSAPFDLFFGRPFAGFENFSTSKEKLLSAQQIVARWKAIYEVILPSVRLRRQKAQEISSRSRDSGRDSLTDDITPGTLVMVETEHGNHLKRRLFEAPFEGPCLVERRARSGNYVLREIETGNLLLSKPLNKLKVLGHVKPVALEASRRNPHTGLMDWQVKYNNGMLLWVVGDSKVVDLLQGGKVDNKTTERKMSNSQQIQLKQKVETEFEANDGKEDEEDIVIHLSE